MPDPIFLINNHVIVAGDLRILFSWDTFQRADTPFQVAAVIATALAILIFSFAIYNRSRARKEWKEAAKSLQIAYIPSAFLSLRHLIRGSYRGHKVNVSVYRHKQGQNTKYYTEYECPLAPEWDCGVRIGSRGKWLMKAFVPVLSRADILEVGAPQFDDAFYVTGTLPGQIQQALHDPDLISALRGLTEYYRHVEILEGKVRFRHRRVVKDAHKIRMAINRLVDIATKLNDAVSEKEQEPIADLFPDLEAEESDQSEPVSVW